MGIRGIYKEIGAGARVSLLKLAVESLEQRRRPLRLAIDISIWQFQVQAARGGANPAIRTLFYRLVRLLGLPVQPVFVFDGLHKPRFKRNKRSGVGDGLATAMAKRLIRLFGFHVHDAPGEAEAECALLQQRGVVDAVLSEDVDTLMFGCTRTLRNWGAAGDPDGHAKSKGGGPPTHVTMYDTAILAPSIAAGLDRQGMVLVALMSGGDYLPEGVPGCGIKLACEAARAGFGRSLCQVKRADHAAVAAWRARLQHELRTNAGGAFRTLHHKLVIPDAFPDLDVLRYYTHPVVSTADVVARVREVLEGGQERQEGAASQTRGTPIDVPGLRAFVAETFDWVNRPGAVKFIHVLAPSLLARMLLLQWGGDDEDLVDGISRQRCHPSTDGLPELRVSFVPAAVVGLDLASEIDIPWEGAPPSTLSAATTTTSYGRGGLALNSDDEDAADEQGKPNGAVAAATAAPTDPTKPTMVWIARAILQIGAPRALEAWDTRQQQQQQLKDQKAQRQREQLERKRAGTGAQARTGRGRGKGADEQAGALDRFVQVTKRGTKVAETKLTETKAAEKPAAEKPTAKTTEKAPVKKVPPRQPQKTQDVSVLSSDTEGEMDSDDNDDDLPVFSSPVKSPPLTRQPVRKGANPWTRAGAQTPGVTKTTKATTKTKTTKTTTTKPQAVVIDLLSSSPVPARDEAPKASKAPRTQTKTKPLRKQTSLHNFFSPSKGATLDLSSSPPSPPSPPPITARSPEMLSEPDLPEIPSSPPLPPSPSPAKRRTRYVPRASAVGYFREEEGEASAGEAGGAGSAGRRRGWRLSEVSMVDLTGLE